MTKKTILSLILSANIISCLDANAETFHIKPCDEDMTLHVREILSKTKGCDDITLSFEKGTYHFSNELSYEEYVAITNHGNGMKKIAFPLKFHSKVRIEGNGAKFLFHGQMMPFLFEECKDIEVRDITIDWDIPYTFTSVVVAQSEKRDWLEVKPRTKEDGYSWVLRGGRIDFPNIDGFSYSILGSSLAFDPITKTPLNGLSGFHSSPERVEQLPNGNLKIYEKLKEYIPVGSILSSKGDRDHDRYAPAFDFKSCSDITLERVTIHHALGMAFLFERSENITIRESRVCVEENSPRVISSTADATHFANCRGDILIENCLFENMLDDGTNVHGTYVEIRDVVDSHTLRLKYKHFEQLGFKFADVGDYVWFILAPNTDKACEARVTKVNVLNELLFELTFDRELPEGIKSGDIVENKSWNPTYTMRGTTIRHHRARSIVLKTPHKIVIEDNNFSSMMSSVLFRGEAKKWFESGAVADVLIQNNRFSDVGYSGDQFSALDISPIFDPKFKHDRAYDRGIRFINNTIEGANPTVVSANHTEGLVVKGNTLRKIEREGYTASDAPMIKLTNCTNCTIENNLYDKGYGEITTDDVSRRSLKIKNNKEL